MVSCACCLDWGGELFGPGRSQNQTPEQCRIGDRIKRSQKLLDSLSSTFSATFWKMLAHKTFYTIILIFLNIANICKADDRSDEDTNDVDR